MTNEPWTQRRENESGRTREKSGKTPVTTFVASTTKRDIESCLDAADTSKHWRRLFLSLFLASPLTLVATVVGVRRVSLCDLHYFSQLHLHHHPLSLSRFLYNLLSSRVTPSQAPLVTADSGCIRHTHAHLTEKDRWRERTCGAHGSVRRRKESFASHFIA